MKMIGICKNLSLWGQCDPSLVHVYKYHLSKMVSFKLDSGLQNYVLKYLNPPVLNALLKARECLLQLLTYLDKHLNKSKNVQGSGVDQHHHCIIETDWLFGSFKCQAPTFFSFSKSHFVSHLFCLRLLNYLQMFIG